MSIPPMQVHQVRYDLPNELLAHVGRVIVLWAHLEQYAQLLVYRLLGINEKQGRVAAQSGNLSARYEIISTLAFLHGLKIEDEVVALKKSAEKYKEKRDLLAHSVWYLSDKNSQWMIQLTRGDLARPPHAPRHMGKRKLRPAGVPMGTTQLEIMSADLEDMIRDTWNVDQMIDAQLRPSLRKQHSQSLKRLRSRLQKTKRRQARSRSLRR